MLQDVRNHAFFFTLNAYSLAEAPHLGDSQTLSEKEGRRRDNKQEGLMAGRKRKLQKREESKERDKKKMEETEKRKR